MTSKPEDSSNIGIELTHKAKSIRVRAHAPYSGYRVGVALMDEFGNIHLGCNVENAAYPLGMCAEAIAIGSMVATGGGTIRRLAIAGGKEQIELCPPCGGCRQRIQEFADDATEILLLDGTGDILTYHMKDLLPLAFSLGNS